MVVCELPPYLAIYMCVRALGPKSWTQNQHYILRYPESLNPKGRPFVVRLVTKIVSSRRVKGTRLEFVGGFATVGFTWFHWCTSLRFFYSHIYT